MGFSGAPVMNQGSSPFGAAGALEMANYGQQATAYGQQGEYAAEAGALQALQTANQAAHFRETQASETEANGILNSGSPLLNEEYTRSQASMEVNATMAAAKAQARNYYQSGLNLMNNGRAALLGQGDQYFTQEATNKISQLVNEANFWGGIGIGGLSSILSMGGSALSGGSGFGMSSWGFGPPTVLNGRMVP